MPNLLSIVQIVQANWGLILTCLTAVSSVCSAVAANTDHAGSAQPLLLKIVGVLSFLEHQNVTGWKLPGMPSQAPTMPPVDANPPQGGGGQGCE